VSLKGLIRLDPQRALGLNGFKQTEALLELLVVKHLVIFVHKLDTVLRYHVSDGSVNFWDLE